MKKSIFYILFISLYFISCDPTSTEINPETKTSSILLKADKYSTYTGENSFISFNAYLEDGTDITGESDFYVNDSILSGNTFSSDIEGEFEVYAIYQDIESNKKTINIVTQVESPSSFTKKILVEDFTGTWCGYCPRIAYKLDEAKKSNPNIIPVGIHYGDNMEYSFVQQLMTTYGIEGFPTALINRSTHWTEQQFELDNLLSQEAKLGIAISSKKSNNILNLDIKIGFASEISEDLKLVVYIVEDSIIESQRNYMNNDSSSPWFNAGDPIVNFVHHNIVRVSFTDIYGDPIPNYLTLERNTYTTDLALDISKYNIDNLSIVAFVVEGATNFHVYNAQIAKAGTIMNFD